MTVASKPLATSLAFQLAIPALSLLALSSAACTVGPVEDGRAPFVTAGDLDDVGDGVGEEEDEEPTPEDDAGGSSGGVEPEEPEPTGDDEPTGEDDPAEPEVCEVLSFAAPEVTPEIMLVIDRSSSMVHTTYESYVGPEAEPQETTRWGLVHGVLEELVDSLDTRARFGAQLFPAAQGDPQVPGSECDVGDAPVLSLAGEAPEDTLGALKASIPSANAGGFYGASPMRAAVEQASEHLLALESDEPKALVLLTDGASNCAEGAEESFEVHDATIPEQLAALADEHGIPTFVVGLDPELEGYAIPAVNPYSALNKLALAGGRPMGVDQAYYDSGDVDALQSALEELRRTRQCAFTPELGGAFAPDALRVHLAGETLTRVDSCDGAGGWIGRSDDDGALSQLELCDATCDLFVGGESLEVELLCE